MSLFTEFFDGIRDIPSKNAGGCLFFCYAFKRFFEENDGDLNKLPFGGWSITIKETLMRIISKDEFLKWIFEQDDDMPLSWFPRVGKYECPMIKFGHSIGLSMDHVLFSVWRDEEDSIIASFEDDFSFAYFYDTSSKTYGELKIVLQQRQQQGLL